MALFGFGKKEKKKEGTCCCAETPVENTAVSCACNSGAPASEASVPSCCGDKPCGINSIKVLGAGCKSCRQQYENCKAAVSELGVNLPVEYVTDMEKVMSYGVMSMPAIVVNGEVVSMGKVRKPAEVVELLKQRGYC